MRTGRRNSLVWTRAKLFPDDVHVSGGFNANADIVGANPDDRDRDLVPDHDAFAGFS